MIDKRLLQEMPQATKYIGKQVLMQWIGMLCNIAFVILIATILTQLFNNQLKQRELLWIGIGIIVILGIRTWTTKLATQYSYHASCFVKDHLRKRLYEKLLLLKNDYTSHIATSELVQLSVEGIDQLEIYFGRYLPQFFYSMVAPVTLFLMLVWMDMKSAFVLLFCVPLIPLSIMVIQKIAKKLLSRYWNAYATLGDSFLENLQGMTTLKIYQSDEYKNKEMNKEAENFRRITMKVLTMQLNSVSVMDVIAYGGAAIGSILAILAYRNGSLSLFGVICIVLLSSEFFIPLRLLGSYFHIAMNGIAASSKIFAILDIDTSKQDHKKHLLDKISISLEHVSFSYDAQRWVLSDVSLQVKQGDNIAIVGESGSGKSTIAKLIVGLAKEYKGNILISNIQRNEIDDVSFYQKVLYVTHKPMIFKGSIKDNLGIAKEGIKEEDMVKALQQVQLYDFVKQNGGLTMSLQEQGSNLSGGQKQRLQVARAILADREVYIFDEATSNIDKESEDAILQAIRNLGNHKTIILITHRLSTVVNSNSIYVLEKGKCIEQGNHEQLLHKKGVYQTMYKKQESLEQFYGGTRDEER